MFINKIFDNNNYCDTLVVNKSKGIIVSSDNNQLIIQTLPENNITDIQRKIITDRSVGPSNILVFVQYIVKTNTDIGTAYINSVWRFFEPDAKDLRINNSSKSKELAEKSMFEVMKLVEFAIKSNTVNMWNDYDDFSLYINLAERDVMTDFFKRLNQIYETRTNGVSPTLTGFLLDVAQRRQNDIHLYLDTILDKLHTK